ncbi:MAG: methyl-accepting chemotaxis protein [Gemmatimonadaceae bacterium]|nr:methyl-accepting chemotaxis protein [Gemmatimonadaceae bacterium]
MTSAPIEIGPRASTGGLLRPMLSMLQRRALVLISIFAAVFLLGLILISWRLHDLLTPDVRAAVLDTPGVRLTLYLFLVWILGATAARSFMIMRFIKRNITEPVASLARLSEAVGTGELSIPFLPSTSTDEVGRLSRATAGMIDDLRELATTLRESAADTTRLAHKITESSQSVASAAQQNAATSDELSKNATARQLTVLELVSGATRMTETFGALREASEEGLRRERRLRSVAEENRMRLDENSRALDSLTTDSLASVEAIGGLASAVEEIRAFLTLVQKISRQSKLLALNAAMEAARAGEQGEGFAVVAAEVRRLAASSAEAAQRTDGLVKQMVENVDRARDCTNRTVTTARGVMETMLLGRRVFTKVEYSAKEAEEWSGRVEETIGDAAQVATTMSEKLNQIAKETEAFVRTMRFIAFSSDEQSRAIADIAAGAAELTRAANLLCELVSTFKLS